MAYGSCSLVLRSVSVGTDGHQRAFETSHAIAIEITHLMVTIILWLLSSTLHWSWSCGSSHHHSPHAQALESLAMHRSWAPLSHFACLIQLSQLQPWTQHLLQWEHCLFQLSSLQQRRLCLIHRLIQSISIAQCRLFQFGSGGPTSNIPRLEGGAPG